MGARANGWMAIGLVAALAGCGGDDDGDGGTADASGPAFDGAPTGCPEGEPSASPSANNSAFLTGAALGTGEEPLEDLRKPVEVNLTAASSLEVGQAWAMRPLSSLEGAYLAIEVSNPTGELLCRIAAEPYQWRGEGGALIEGRERTFLVGSVGIDDPLDAATCLGPNETGYLLDINLADVYDQLVSVDLELTFTAEGVATPAAAIVPTGYTTGDLGRIEVAFENTGTGAGTIDPDAVAYGTVVLLDELGAPVIWTSLDADLAPEDGVVAAGAEGSVAGSTPFGGCASALRGFLSFTP